MLIATWNVERPSIRSPRNRLREAHLLGLGRRTGASTAPSAPVQALLLLLFTAAQVGGQGLTLAEETLSFGVLDGPEDQLIASVEDVAVSPDGDLLVVDRQSSRVGWIRPDGSFGGWFGRDGDGPREFRYLGDADELPDGRFVVVDSGHMRLVVMTLGPDSLAIVESVRLELIPDGMCLLGNRIFVSALWEGATLHEVSWTGELLRSFAPPIDTGARVTERWQPMVARYSAMAELVCLEERGLVVALPTAIGTVRAFGTDGALKWQRQLEPWSQARWSTTEQGRFRMSWDPETGFQNAVHRAWLLDERRLAIQVGEHGPSRVPPERFEVRILDLDSGRVANRQGNLPLIAAVQGDHVVGWEEIPFPRIFRRRLLIDVERP